MANEGNKGEFEGLDGFYPSKDINGNAFDDPFGVMVGIATDPATRLAEDRGQYLEIHHIPSDNSIKFKAYITDFQDKYDSTWTDAEVYGRMDPIMQFQGTKRVISLDWAVPATSREEAKFNHQKCSLLFSMLYPHYETQADGAPSSATQISTSPLFKVKFGNLIQDPSLMGGSGSPDAKASGLVGAISGFTYAPDLEQGFIDDVGDGFGTLYPKSIKLSLEYTVLHTFQLGWNGTGKRTAAFPYGVGQGSTPLSDMSTAPAEVQEAAEDQVTGN